jgi:predicted flap endonuclease-1-like 5' DNA nuclease
MFKNWGFLLGEMWVLILLAALLGLLAGWLIWGRRSEVTIDNSKADRLQDELTACRRKSAQNDQEIARLTGDLNAAKAFSAEVAAPAVEPVAEPATDSAQDGVDMSQDYDGDGILEGKNEGSKPETLSGPRDGKADDLKQIKGVGPKMEILCNQLGFYHFDQVAKWSDAEVAWVDANLEGFKGRVSRDNWVDQAKTLAAGGATEFSKRVEKGSVY